MSRNQRMGLIVSILRGGGLKNSFAIIGEKLEFREVWPVYSLI